MRWSSWHPLPGRALLSNVPRGAKYRGPFAEAQVRGDDDARALIEFAQQMEEQSAPRGAERQVAPALETLFCDYPLSDAVLYFALLHGTFYYCADGFHTEKSCFRGGFLRAKD